MLLCHLNFCAFSVMKMKKIVTFILIGLAGCSYADVLWEKVTSGIEAATIKEGIFTISPDSIAYRIDPNQYYFKLAFARPTAFVEQIGSEAKALIAVNGGYFNTDFKPMGLRVSGSQQLNSKRLVSWWGVFYIDKDNKPHLSANRHYQSNKNVGFAIQAGPRLIANGKILPLKEGKAQRSAICATQQSQVIIAVTQNNSLTLNEWAKQLLDMGCVDALNLDGGTSSQLYTDLPKHNHLVNNYKPVHDAIVVFSAEKAKYE